MAKVLVIDIETAPNIAYVWRFFKENIGPKQVLENGQLISFAYKWLGEKVTACMSGRRSGERDMLVRISELLDEADIVIAHYGDGFDFPYIQARMAVHHIKPPSPFKTIDTKRVASKEFHFPSYSLEYLANALNLQNRKDGHKKFPGFELWLGVIRNDDEAWKEMEHYNIIDVEVLEELYLRIRPFIRNHPNVAVYNEHDAPHCPKCNSNQIQYRGYAHTNVGRFHRFQCNDCGGWSRTRHNVADNKNRLVNAVN